MLPEVFEALAAEDFCGVLPVFRFLGDILLEGILSPFSSCWVRLFKDDDINNIDGGRNDEIPCSGDRNRGSALLVLVVDENVKEGTPPTE